MARRYQEPVTGERALVGLEGFMKGWQFGSSILREQEDKADREQSRKDAATDRAWKGEERGRTREGWKQADEDRQYTIDTRETPEEVKGRRKTDADLKAESLAAAQRGNRQAPTDAEAAEERALGLESKRIGNKNAQDANARAWNADRREGRKEKEKDESGKVLAALDYFQRNQSLLDPSAMSAVERLYTGLATGDMSKAKRGDVDMAANVFKDLLDKRTDWKGMPIVDRRARTLFKDGKVVLEMAYKVRQPDGSVVDVDAGPVSKASTDGTDVVYEIDDADAMKLLAAHTLIGRDIKKMAEAGYASPAEAIDQLRQQYLESQGGSGVDELKKIDPTAAKGGLEQKTIKFGDQEVMVQFDKELGVTDATPIIGGAVYDDDNNPVQARTVGELKQKLGLSPPMAAAGQAFVTPSASQPRGLVEPGNIDINARPIVKLPNGQIATVNSMSFQAEKGGPEILIPQVSDDGRMLTAKEAIKEYERTGKHLGKFRTPEEATAYAKTLHEDQDKQYGKSGGADRPKAVTSQAEVAALPKGAKFIFNGKEYTKK